MMRLSILFLVATLIPALARATSPCSPDSWFSTQGKGQSDADWAKHSSWIVEGELSARKERHEPYPNCYTQDLSQCAMLDMSELTFTHLHWKKSAPGAPTPDSIKLQSGKCAPPPPSEIGVRFRIFGNSDNLFQYIEKIR